jgi:hypothetical protein
MIAKIALVIVRLRVLVLSIGQEMIVEIKKRKEVLNMADNKKQYREAIREEYMEAIKTFLEREKDEVLQVASNEFAIPVVRADGEEDYLVLTFKMPTGSRDGDGYDGYAMAQDYAFKCDEKRKKAEAAKAAKEKKIARDKAKREAKEKEKGE